MKKVYSFGLDIAKNVFQVSPADKHGRQIANKKLRRNQVVSFKRATRLMSNGQTVHVKTRGLHW